MTQKLAVLAGSLSMAQAMLGFGACPKPTLISSFDTTAMQGQWFEIERDMMFPYEMTAECVTHEYKLTSDANLRFRFRGWYPMMLFTYNGVGGELQQCSNGSSETWTCQGTMDDFPGTSPFSFLSADPDSYFVMYNCGEMFDGGMHAHFITIMSRSTEMSAD